MPTDDLFSDDAAEDWPDEPDPPSESLGPGVPTVPDYSNRDVPQELRREFWTAVVLANIALGGISIGLMLIGFQRRWLFGGGLIAVGLVALVRCLHVYRTRTTRKD